MGEVILLEGEGHNSEFQKHEEPLCKGLRDTFPSSQDQVGKISIVKVKRAKAQDSVSTLQPEDLILLDDESISKAQIISLPYDQIYLFIYFDQICF